MAEQGSPGISGISDWSCPKCGRVLDNPADQSGILQCLCGHSVYTGYLAEASAIRARLGWLDERIVAGDPPPSPVLARQYGVWPPVVNGHVGTNLPSEIARQPKFLTGQTLLLSLGAGLLIIAGIVFTALVWKRLGAGGQVAVMAVATIGFASLAVWLGRRLPGTAEALAAVAFGLLVIDVIAAPILGLVARNWLAPDRAYPFALTLVGASVTLAMGWRFELRVWHWLGWGATGLGAALFAVYISQGLAAGAQPGASLAVLVVSLAAVGLLAGPVLLNRLKIDQRAMLPGGAIATLVAIQGWAQWIPDHGRWALVGTLITTVLTCTAVAFVWRRTGALASGLVTLALAGAALGLTLLLMGESTTIPWVVGVGVVGMLVVGLGWWRELLARALTVASIGWLTWVVGRVATFGPDGPTNAQRYQFAALFAMAALTYLTVAAFSELTEWGWAAAALGELAWLLGWQHFSEIEWATLPLAGLLLLAGWLWHRQLGVESSRWELPAATVAIVPSALACWGAPWVVAESNQATSAALLRLILVLAVGFAMVVPGARGRLQGLLVPGVAGLVLAGGAQLSSGLSAVPRWLALAVVGAALILAGARLEVLRKRGREVRDYLATLH
ncbi:MAG: hypothetical protein WCJ42_06650 [Actinomycetes bacterium]